MKELLFIGAKNNTHTELIAEYVDKFFVSRVHTLSVAHIVAASRTLELIIFLHDSTALTTIELNTLSSLATHTTSNAALILTEYVAVVRMIRKKYPNLRVLCIDNYNFFKIHSSLQSTISSIIQSSHTPQHSLSAKVMKTSHSTQDASSIDTDMTKQKQLKSSNSMSLLMDCDVDNLMDAQAKWQYASVASRNIEPFISMCANSTNRSILIIGETGTGKDMVAKRIHYSLYGDPDKFIAVNCSAIPETLFENEMYGSEEGAFTGAKRKMGYFEMADEGTLFLNEIGELSLSSQAKLLHVMDKQGYYTVGGTTKKNPKFCCITATNRDLYDMVDKGFFRTDLYYRIMPLSIAIPSLRSRREDIVILANEFVREMSGNQKSLTTDAIDKLVQHDWPGNIRELKNCIQRSVVRCSSSVIDGSLIDLSTAHPIPIPA